MTKSKHIAFLKKQIKIGEDIMLVAKQNYESAARSVSEAKSALLELGGSTGQARKSKHELTEKEIIELRSKLIK